MEDKKFWKFVLMIIGAGILSVTIAYSNYLAARLKENEEKTAFIFKEALNKQINDAEKMSNVDESTFVFLDTIIKSFTLPTILEDESGQLEGYNFGDEKNRDSRFLAEKKKKYLASGEKPLFGSGYYTYVYCFNSPLLDYIKYFPFIQALLVGLYILLGYYIFNASRKSEQNRVWAGMAKETAHQLGTPISAIMGWVEYLKEMMGDIPEKTDVISELEKDVARLELVAERFSKIGSEPILTKYDIGTELEEVKNYIARRAPRKTVIEILKPQVVINCDINKHLFAWVIENLLRNAIDAFEKGEGKIIISMYEDKKYVHIDITDNGHGIPSGRFKSIFKPGYSTKKRGWGLGLSLAKRIICEYHKGEIFVKESKPFIQTTFTIKLKKF